jgi:hypothetical protein
MIKKKAKQIRKTNIASRLEGDGRLKGFQTAVRLGSRVGGIYSTRDV